MAEWYGVKRTWTPNELNFMTKAAYSCRSCQEEGQCEWGCEDCMECKWRAPMGSIKELDPFLQSRIEDEADKIEFRNELFMASLERSREAEKVGRRKLYIFLVSFIIIIATASCLVANAMPQTARTVMRQLSQNGPDNYYYDEDIDCKDWSITFMDLWYKQDVPDGSCILVRNLNKSECFDHLMVAVKDNNNWLVLEPQACKWGEKYWDPNMWWGKKYDSSNDMFGQTWLYLRNADKKADDLMSKSKATFEEFEWSVSHEVR